LSLAAYPSALFAVLFEIFSVQALLAPTPNALAVLGWHFLALLAAVPALRPVFPEEYQRSGWTFAALVIGFALPLPVLGPLFLLGYRLLLLLKPARNVESKYVLGTTQYLTLPAYEQEVHEAPRSVAEILNGKDNVVRRTAILALRVVEPKKALPLLQKAIQDSDEQVRLLAQTQFNQIIARLEGRVKTLEAELATPPRHLNKLLLLAEQYHEMVYLGLATDETQTIYLNRAVELLTEAGKLAPDNTAVRFLLVKCALKSGHLDQARDGILFLRRKGWQAEVLVPWEAEIAYLERDWLRLAATLQAIEGSGATPGILRGPMEFWLTPAKG
jgi:tetratricopeptide (TPR) repeat protein